MVLAMEKGAELLVALPEQGLVNLITPVIEATLQEDFLEHVIQAAYLQVKAVHQMILVMLKQQKV